jgi:hypothetical protein
MDDCSNEIVLDFKRHVTVLTEFIAIVCLTFILLNGIYELRHSTFRYYCYYYSAASVV